MNKRLVTALLSLLALLAAGTFLDQEPDTHAQASPDALIQMSRAAQVGGSIEAVTVSGTYAYAGIGWQLAVFDISSAASPVLVGQIYVGGTAEGIAAAGGHAYVVDGNDTLPAREIEGIQRLIGDDFGIVDQDVDPAVLGEDRLDGTAQSSSRLTSRRTLPIPSE